MVARKYRKLHEEAQSKQNTILVFNLEEVAKSVSDVLRSFICDALHVKSHVVIKSVKCIGQPRIDGKRTTYHYC